MKNNFKIFILILIIAIIGIFIYFLNNRTSVEKTPSIITGNSIIGCYVAHLQKDIYTIVIQSEDKGSIVGALAYNNFSK